MIKTRWILAICLSGVIAAQAAKTHAAPNGQEPPPNTPIEHIVILMQNNHTFDNYFGTYPGADGLLPDTCVLVNPFNLLDQSCVRPYYLGNRGIDDLSHSQSTFFLQYNGGEMNGFIHGLNQRNQDGTIALGYYDDRDIPYYWNMADEYVLFDRFFSSAHGGSVWNRMFAVAAVPGNERNRIPLGGYKNISTIFDRLEERGISWKFYVSNYDPKRTYRNLNQNELLNPQIQWVPLLGFDRFIDDPKLFGKIVDMNEYYKDLEQGTLPAVSYVLALGSTEHPLSSLEAGQRFVRNMLQALMVSEAWSSSAFLLTYDDWGGWYDHVPPPQVDEYGYGFRVPALLVSPYAKRGHIESTELDFTSILKFIEENWDLVPLSERDARANNILGAFDFNSHPRNAQFISTERQPEIEQTKPNLLLIFSAYAGSLILSFLIFLMAFLNKLLKPLKIRSRRRIFTNPREKLPVEQEG